MPKRPRIISALFISFFGLLLFAFDVVPAQSTFYSIREVTAVTAANAQTRYWTQKINNLGYATGQTQLEFGEPWFTIGGQVWIGGVQFPATGQHFSTGYTVKNDSQLVVGAGNHLKAADGYLR